MIMGDGMQRGEEEDVRRTWRWMMRKEEEKVGEEGIADWGSVANHPRMTLDSGMSSTATMAI